MPPPASKSASARSTPISPSPSPVLGAAYTEAGRFGKARPVLERAHRLSLEHWGPTAIRTKLVDFHLAKLDLATGHLDRAVSGLEDVLAFRRANFAEGDLAVGTRRHPSGRAYLRQGRVAEAEPLAREVLDIFRRHLPPKHPWIGEAEAHLADVVGCRPAAPDRAPPRLSRQIRPRIRAAFPPRTF